MIRLIRSELIKLRTTNMWWIFMLCSLVFIGLSVGSSSVGPLGALWLICFLISAGGVALIVYAIRNRPKSG